MRRIPTAHYSEFVRQLAKDLTNPVNEIRATTKTTAVIGRAKPAKPTRASPKKKKITPPRRRAATAAGSRRTRSRAAAS